MVNYSWKLGQALGIDIRVHWSFLILPAWIALTRLAAGAALVSAVSAILFIFVVFGCVLLHELGHALAARRYGIATLDITLLPIGGLARLERIPRVASQELVIALAGPAASLATAVLFGAAAMVGGAVSPLGTLLPGSGSLLANLTVINLGLAIFNLLPAFPMDGGRVLRALLAMRIPYARATRVAASLAQAIAFCLAIVGLFGNWTLLLVALFVSVSARSEAAMVSEHPLPEEGQSGGSPAGKLALLPAHARAVEVAGVLGSQQYYFPVVQAGEIVGTLSRHALFAALSSGQGGRLVAELMTEACYPTSGVAFQPARQSA